MYRVRVATVVLCETGFEKVVALEGPDPKLAIMAEYVRVIDMLDVEIMLAALIAARDQFNFYAEQHEAKDTDDGRAKAATNREMAARMQAAIGGVS